MFDIDQLKRDVECINARLQEHESMLRLLIRNSTQQLRNEGRLMASTQDLDAAIAAESAALSSLSDAVAALGALATKTQADVEALKSQVAPDLQAELDAISANQAKAAAIASAVAAASAAVQAADDAAAPAAPPAPPADEPPAA